MSDRIRMRLVAGRRLWQNHRMNVRLRRILAALLLGLCALSPAHAYTEEEILAALQRRAELSNADKTLDLSDADKKVIDNFLKENEALFASLGPKEAFYYVDLVKLNRNESVRPNLCLSAVSSAQKHWSDYSEKQRDQLNQVFESYVEAGYISKAQLEKTIRRAEKEASNP